MPGNGGQRRGRRGFLAELAERTGASAGAQVALGEPVEHDGVVVIPVANARWGLGAGPGGVRRELGSRGEGGGGGIAVSPVGYIELRDGGARYRPVFDAATHVPLALAAGACCSPGGWRGAAGHRKGASGGSGGGPGRPRCLPRTVAQPAGRGRFPEQDIRDTQVAPGIPGGRRTPPSTPTPRSAMSRNAVPAQPPRSPILVSGG